MQDDVICATSYRLRHPSPCILQIHLKAFSPLVNMCAKSSPTSHPKTIYLQRKPMKSRNQNPRARTENQEKTTACIVVLHAVRTSPLRIRPPDTPEDQNIQGTPSCSGRARNMQEAPLRPSRAQQLIPDSQEEEPTAPQEPRHSE